MVISPNDFSLWSRLTGNKYPSTPRERAQKGPEVQRFIQNLGREGMLGGKQQQEKKKERSLPEKIATGALIAGGVAALGAAARDKRVQDVAQRAGSTVRDRTQQFLKNLGPGQEVDVDIIDASGDVTPNPRLQQANVAPTPKQLRSGPESMKPGGFGSRIVGPLPDVSIEDSVDFDIQRSPSDPTYGAYGEDVQLGNVKDIMREQEQLAAFTGETSPGIDPVSGVSYEDIKQKLQDTAAARGVKQPVAVDNFTPISKGEPSFTEGAISKEDPYGDISNLGQRVDRTYGKFLSNLKPEDAARTRESLIRGAGRERDYALGYMNAMARGRTDEAATLTGRKFGGFDLNPAVRPQTPFREALSQLKVSSIRPGQITSENIADLGKTTSEKITALVNTVQPGQITRVEGIDQSQLNKYGTWENNTQVSMNNNTPDNKVIKVGAEIGGPTLVDQHATEMAVDNALDNARSAYEKQISTIVDAGKTSGGSIRSRAGAEAFLQRFRPNVVKNLDTAIQEDLQATTGLNPEDAANIAESVIDPTTGQRQFDTDRFGEAGAETKRTIKDLKSVPNIDPDTNQGIMKTAVGTAIRGRAPSYYEALPKTETRELPGKFEEIVPDRRTATRGGFGAALQKSIEEEGISPAKMPEGGSAGIGIYGEGTGYLAGPFSETAKKAPTDVPGVSSPFKGVSDERVKQFKADAKPGTKTFESADKELKGRASMDAARELRKIQTSGDPNTATERVAKFLDNLKKQQGG